MPNEGCAHEKSAPREMLEELPQSQAGTGRHKCAVCAYNAGFQDGVAAGRRLASRERRNASEGD